MTKLSKEINVKVEQYIEKKLIEKKINDIKYCNIFELWECSPICNFKHIANGGYTEIVDYIKKECWKCLNGNNNKIYRVLSVEHNNNICGIEFDLKDF